MTTIFDAAAALARDARLCEPRPFVAATVEAGVGERLLGTARQFDHFFGGNRSSTLSAVLDQVWEAVRMQKATPMPENLIREIEAAAPDSEAVGGAAAAVWAPCTAVLSALRLSSGIDEELQGLMYSFELRRIEACARRYGQFGLAQDDARTKKFDAELLHEPSVQDEIRAIELDLASCQDATIGWSDRVERVRDRSKGIKTIDCSSMFGPRRPRKPR